MTEPTLEASADLVATAREAAEAAAQVHRLHAGRVRIEEASMKRASDFVSRVDLEAQEAALAVIRDRFPEHEIMSEEEDGRTGPGSWEGAATGPGLGSAAEPGSEAPHTAEAPRFVWVVDPLDGTTNFLHGHPAYAASVGVLRGGEPVAGAVTAAATEERWWAGRGRGAFRNGEPIAVSRVRELALALVGSGFPFKWPELVPGYMAEFERVLSSTSGIRRGGSAALDLCYLAQGSLDAFWEAMLEPWDVAAGLAILYEAGGVATRKDGSELRVGEGGSVLAANGAQLMEELRATVAGRGSTRPGK